MRASAGGLDFGRLTTLVSTRNKTGLVDVTSNRASEHAGGQSSRFRTYYGALYSPNQSSRSPRAGWLLPMHVSRRKAIKTQQNIFGPRGSNNLNDDEYQTHAVIVSFSCYIVALAAYRWRIQ